MDSVRERVAGIVAAIEPLDELEREHRDSTIEWIRSGAPIFRTMKPDVPPKHLVSYFALVDEQRGKLLLVDHKLAGLWLPSGGHVEPDEDPAATVVRELSEELASRRTSCTPGPLFITVTRTVGEDGGHTDVSLWYLLRGDSSRAIEFDRGEFHGVRWFGFDEIPFERSDACIQPLASSDGCESVWVARATADPRSLRSGSSCKKTMVAHRATSHAPRAGRSKSTHRIALAARTLVTPHNGRDYLPRRRSRMIPAAERTER